MRAMCRAACTERHAPSGVPNGVQHVVPSGALNGVPNGVLHVVPSGALSGVPNAVLFCAPDAPKCIGHPCGAYLYMSG